MTGLSAFEEAGLPVESQLLFSSTSAVWSQTGAAHYAAANSFLDGVGAARRYSGLPATVLQLGPFAGAGMAAHHIDELEAIGLQALQPKQARGALAALCSGCTGCTGCWE